MGRDERSSEDRLIARFFGPLATHRGALGLTDDAAFLSPPPGCDLVLTADALVAGVHFFAGDDATSIAQKAMRVNLSDLAAKGAQPLGFLVTLAMTQDTDDAWLAGFAEGLRRDSEAYACPLFGGDTVKTPGLVSISISMFGSVPQGTMVRRAGAKPGDVVYVTGTIGDGALGLLVRQGKAPSHENLLSRYLVPQPRNALAEAVRIHASAAMDVSDGLAGDLAKLCRVSGVAAVIDVANIPLSDAARALIATDPSLRDTALTGGDDYEILCTVPPGRAASFEAAAKAAGVPVTVLGTVAAGEGARFIDDGQTFLCPACLQSFLTRRRATAKPTPRPGRTLLWTT